MAIGVATPNVGKTHIRWARLLVDSVNLSGDTRQVGSFGLEHNTTDITGYSDGVHHSSVGQANHIFNGYQAAFSNTATSGSHTELKDLEDYIVSFCIGVKAAPEVGSVAWLSSMVQISYDVSSNGMLVGVDFAKSITDRTHSNPWGHVLEAGTARTATLEGEGIDNLEVGNNGIVAHLHVLSTGAVYQFDIETSDDDAESDAYASIGTFSLNGSVVGAERMLVAGAVEQYLRVKATKSSGNVTFWCTVARGVAV